MPNLHIDTYSRLEIVELREFIGRQISKLIYGGEIDIIEVAVLGGSVSQDIHNYRSVRYDLRSYPKNGCRTLIDNFFAGIPLHQRYIVNLGADHMEMINDLTHQYASDYGDPTHLVWFKNGEFTYFIVTNKNDFRVYENTVGRVLVCSAPFRHRSYYVRNSEGISGEIMMETIARYYENRRLERRLNRSTN